MAFAQPLALLFFLLFIPIILLYLLKQRRRRVAVSTLLFWDKILRDEHRVTSLTRLRKLLSLLLQLLFVTLLTLAVARPVLSRDLLGTRRIVVLIDVSASMSVTEPDGTRFEHAKQLASEVVRSMVSGDSTMLVAVSDRVSIVSPFSDSRKQLLEVVKKLEATHAETRFERAFELLAQLPPDERTTHVYVISDGAFDPIPFESPRDTRFTYLRTGTSRDNVGITSFQLRPLPSSPRDFEILFELSNETDQERRVPFELRIEDELIDANEVTLPPGKRVTRTLTQFSPEGGRVELVIDHPDPFPVDNHAYAVLPELEPIRVLLVTEGNLFLESALATDDALVAQTSSPSDYRPEMGAENQVVIFDQCSPEVDPPGPAMFLASLPPGSTIEIEGELDHPIVTDWRREHPINRYLNLTGIGVGKSLRVTRATGFEPLMSAFTHPLMLLQERESSYRLVTLFDTVSSDLPLRAAFPMLVANAVRFMTGTDPGDRWLGPKPGDILSASEVAGYLPRSCNDQRITQVIKPGEPRHEGEGTARVAEAASPSDVFVSVDRVGLYEGVIMDGRRLPLFGANLGSRGESRIAPSDELPVQTSAPLPEIERKTRLGMEWWFLLALLAFGLSCAEWVCFHRRAVE